MDTRQREKIALIVFALLILLSVCGLCWYLIAGHSWNVAASNIDDTFGEMDGYTAVVFPGTVDPAQVEEDEETQDSVNKRINPERAEKDDPQADDAVDQKKDTGKPLSSTKGTKALPYTSSTQPRPERVSDEEVVAKSGDEDLLDDPDHEHRPVTTDEVMDSYEEKGASVFDLATDDLARYEDGVILKRQGHRYGVFSVDSLMPYKAIEDKVAYFAAYEVDFIVALTPSTSYVSRVAGIDIVITTSNEKLFAMGETIDETFYVNAPLVGEVGVILISPSNVVSAKVVS